MTVRVPGSVAMLPLPPRRRLTDAQADGRACVWCGSTSRDGLRLLGPRLLTPSPYNGDPYWHPKGCVACVKAAARRVKSIHVTVCPHCVRLANCQTHVSLRRLAEGAGL